MAIKKQFLKSKPVCKVTFSFNDKTADSVSVVGSFNNWDPSNHDYDLNLNNNGIWEIDLSLDIGEYEYKVIESNEWNENDWPGINQIITAIDHLIIETT